MKYAPLLFLLISLTTISACSPPAEKEAKAYEDISGFFEAEAVRLSKSESPVRKTVARNDAVETRVVKAINWNTELSLFAESDINKPAWRDSYKVTASDTNIIYLAKDTTLKTRQIHISKAPGGKIRKISIHNRTNNMLYSSTETLLYIPDSLYQIQKQQHVVLIGNNSYLIKGISINK